MPRLCEFYPGISLTTEEKARKDLSQNSRRVTVYIIHITKTPTHYKTRHTHTHIHYRTHTYTHPHITKQYKTTTVQIKTNTIQDTPKWNSHNINKYPKYMVTLMCIVLYSQELQSNTLHFTSLHFTSLQNKISSHKSRQFTPHHYTSHHFTYFHSVPTWIPLLVTTFLTLFLNVFSLQGKGASKLAGNWFQLLMVLFTKEYLPTSVLCFLVLIFRLWSSLLR